MVTSSITPSLSKEPTKPSRVDEFLAKYDPPRARLILAIDATASREHLWDQSAALTYEMFNAVAAVGTLDVQLVHYKGHRRLFVSQFVSDPRQLTAIMGAVTCESGHTQITRVLKHAASENVKNPVAALVLISDASEDVESELYAAAREVKVPVFLFQEINHESDPDRVAGIYGKIAEITGGVAVQFDASSAARLADLLKGVAAFATGGQKALAAQLTEAARLLLTQMKLITRDKK